MSSDNPLALYDQIRARDGALCVYVEHEWIAHVKLTISALTEKMVEFRLDAIPTPGFISPPESTWQAGVAFTEGSFGSDCWLGSPYMRWLVCFDPATISSLITIAQEMQDRPPDERSLALWRRLGAFLHPDMPPDPS